MADMPASPQHMETRKERSLTGRERLVLTLLRQNGPMTRSSLIKATGLSGTAIFRVTEDLVAAGHLILGDPVKEGRGQPSNLVELVPQNALAVGLSVMTDCARVTLMDLSGATVAEGDVTCPGMARRATLEAAAQLVGEVCTKRGLDTAHICGVGLAVAGFFTGEPGHLNPAAELDDWALRDLASDARAVFGRPVTVENIANAAAVGEALLGAGQHYASFAYVSVASGFGGGYILNGEPWRGAFGNAGEFAALLKHAGSPVPHLETLRETLSDHGIHTQSVGDLVARYDPDWPGLENWIATSAPAFRLLTHLIHYSVDVEAVIIGGRLPHDLAARLANAAAIDPEERRGRIRRGIAHPDPVMRPAAIGPTSAAIGAASLPLSKTYFTSLAQLRTRS